MNKTDLITTILSEHQKLEDVLAGFKPDQMENSESDQVWTIKETLVHITSWEQVLLTDYAHLARGEAIHELGSDEEINAWNKETQIRAQSMELDQVLFEFQASFHQIIAWLEKLPETELDRPFMYSMSLDEFIGEDTWKHYQEHMRNLI
jgi:hypothetical protein